MRRCPFSENIDRRIVVAPMRDATVRARPYTVPQGDRLIETSTHRTQLGRREPHANMVHNRSRLAGHMVQRVHKRRKAQIRDFAAPQGFHALEVQRLQGNEVVVCTEIMRQLPMERPALVSHVFMHAAQMALGLPPIAGALLLSSQSAIRLRKVFQGFLQRLRSEVFDAITAGEIRCQPKVKACAVTCHDSVDGLRFNEAGEVHGQVAKRVTLDSHRLDGPFDVSGLGKLIDDRTDLQAIPVEQLPASLRQSERLGLANLAESRRADAPRCFLCRAYLYVGKEPLVACINALRNILDRLRAKLFPPGVLCQFLQFCQMGVHRVQRDIFLIAAVVAFVQGDHVVVDGTTNVNLPMQLPRALVAIELVLKCLAHYFTPSRLACSRIVISSLAVMLMPDFFARASNKRFASRLRRRLVARGFVFIPRV